MRRVDRASVGAPASLAPGGAGPKELDDARDHLGKPDPKDAFKYRAYKGDDIRAALEALFHGKCAYCETVYAASMPVDIEHYRPKGAVSEDAGHGGYWWLAMAWDNVLPSCIDCNRKRGQILVQPSSSLAALAASTRPAGSQSGKKDSFPLTATGVRAVAEQSDFTTEHPLLLDPCRDDPCQSLTYNFDPTCPAGLMLPAGNPGQEERGAASIQIYGLNRLKLVQDRTRILRHLEFLGDLAIELAASISDLSEPAAMLALIGTPAENVSTRLRLLRDRTLAEMKAMAADEAPYCSMVYAWLERYKVRLAGTASAEP